MQQHASTYSVPFTHSRPLWWGHRSKHFFLKVVMLHIQLEGNVIIEAKPIYLTKHCKLVDRLLILICNDTQGELRGWRNGTYVL